MSNADNGKGLKAAKLKVIGTIMVAALGMFGTVASLVVGRISASGSELTGLVVELEATISQLNSLIIPEIQKSFDQLERDYRELLKSVADARERTAKLEGFIKALPRRIVRHAERGVGGIGVGGASSHRPAPRSPASVREPAPKADEEKIPAARKTKIPTLKALR